MSPPPPSGLGAAAAGIEPVDLLAIGPHPDDIEIGMGGTVARHTGLGYMVGMCDLTAGEMGSNGTVDERLAEAEAAREVLGAAWRVNLRLPDRALGSSDEHARAVAGLVRCSRPKAVAIPYWSDRHPDHVAASQLLTDGVFNAGLRRYAAEGEAWKPDWICYYFINDSAKPSFVVDVSRQYEAKRRALACHVTQFTPAGQLAVATRLTSSTFRQLIESRDSQFGALAGVPYAEGFVVKQPVVRPHLLFPWNGR
jgi:bacillithiol biosynthesis deacetylase BshB1